MTVRKILFIALTVFLICSCTRAEDPFKKASGRREAKGPQHSSRTIDDVSGTYTRESEDESAELNVKQLPDGTIHVEGLALWGTDGGAPNTGELDFTARMKDGRAKYSDRTTKRKPYGLELKFHKNGLTAKEENNLGTFGLNVGFEGEYRKK
jgi:hypothetical protein